MVKLGLSRIHFPVTTLGPGNRIGIWFQGCRLRCKGCISADTWGTAKEFVDVDELVDKLTPWLAQADGITISGGEPFDQVNALSTLLQQLKQKTAIDILVYTGYSLEQITEHLITIKPYIDALITDPFQYQTAQTLQLRGSDNQRLHFFTPLGEKRFRSYQTTVNEQEKALDVMFDEDGTVWLAGIPKRNDMQLLQDMLAQQGHRIVLTIDKPRD
ncbi:4Fe-4S single cluster domain-containing protein [Gilliamella intestini]|jgi:anaerobic ribonucleoside-triphosphate reductase activating protein|uniref:Anaerobic ribonucleoside-triphosphate reductase activating protein n=1 Tax=Gilliamella intestini TaxID=1798183 RepID=A0A1C4A3V1_9GAMM|nr:4Fe-4S single cluster domain-containing protein [Gilliamella intestini]SCB89225.1 anaerobic ribonucleoside-triphosphate reductase activating protein [Gilliamella intestini]